MEPISRVAAREVLNYLYEQGFLSQTYNEETEKDVLNVVQVIIRKECDLSC